MILRMKRGIRDRELTPGQRNKRKVEMEGQGFPRSSVHSRAKASERSPAVPLTIYHKIDRYLETIPVRSAPYRFF